MQIFKIGNVQFEIPSQGFVIKVNFEIKFELCFHILVVRLLQQENEVRSTEHDEVEGIQNRCACETDRRTRKAAYYA